jgi:protein TonB
MSGKKQMQPGDFVATRTPDHDGVANLQGATVTTPRASPASDLSNVVPFARERKNGSQSAASPITIGPADRPAPRLSDDGIIYRVALAVGSLVFHGALFLAFWYTPPLSASVGVEAITVEVVIGADTAAGLATDRKENEVEAVATAEEVKAEDKPIEQKPEPPKEQPPDKSQVVEVEPLPEQPKEQQKKEESVPSSPASGIGKGSSAANANYAGLIAAHLARHKQYPAQARNNRIQGTGTVTFSIDGDGRVTAASIARSTGAAVLDKELEAMVQRSSPFPKPPGGQPRSFTVPLTFRLN